ncbi:hypothetical protein BCV72DRAFT_305950 [Rhizopus microsporus var. microsporus]|uniref:Uncharacterized protein n=1 Tax=Rhizopus microsporus var. microsporus TaxID=86635 RepID=A0A1X0R1R8_RHIZD|nr:hypothetical protein BCV72DRAFT_305950 [Rhizopus microsporus var. microsporus]
MIDSKSVHIDAKSFWKLAKQCDNKIKPCQKSGNDLNLWYFNVFDFSKIDYKALESLTSRLKKFANVITTDGYAVSFVFKKTVSIQDEPRREPKAPKDFADIFDDADIWVVDPGISTYLLQLTLQSMDISEQQIWKNTIICVVTILLQENEKDTKSVI